MSISAITSKFKVPLRYTLMRNRQQAYNLLVTEFKRSGLTQAEFARRAKKGTDLICRYLRRPRNVELDTLGELVYALTGGALSFSVTYPADSRAVGKETQLLADRPLTTAGRPFTQTIAHRGTPRVDVTAEAA